MTVAAEVRALTVADLPRCLDLAVDRGWAAETRAWQLLFEFGDVYGVDDEHGGLVATASAVRYGTTLAVIGAMLVARAHAGRGVGTALLRSVLERAGARTTWLTATSVGVPLYRNAGFREVGRRVRYAGTPHSHRAAVSRPATAEDLPALVRLDALGPGVARPRLLSYLFAVAAAVRVVDGPDGPAGYGVCWRGVDSHVVGPVVAADDAVAVALVSDLAREVAGPVRVDLAVDDRALVEWAVSSGLAAGSSLGEMVVGVDPPGDRGLVRAFATGAVG